MLLHTRKRKRSDSESRNPVKNYSPKWRSVFGFLLYLLTIPVTGQEVDPAFYLPKGCNEKNMNCGYIPTSPESYQAFPISPTSKMKHRGLPSSHDLSSSMPPVGSQGGQGSCVAWATTYALKSYQEKKERNWKYDIEWDLKTKPAGGGYYYLVFDPKGTMNNVFSPAFTYNQINRGVDQGSFIVDAMDLIVNKGAVPYSVMPYNEKDFLTKPNSTQYAVAQKFKGLKYYRVDFRNPEAMKAELYKGNPIVIGMLIDDGFTKYKKGVYDRPSGSPKGGHAMTIVGYDDDKTSLNGHKGAYKLINSWGTSWGESGYGWVSYKAMANLNKDAWVLVDEVNTTKDDPSPTPVVQEETKVISPPTDLVATRGNYSDKVVLNWSQVNGANVYIIERAEGADPENFSELAYLEGTNYEDTSVVPDYSYRYRVISGKVEETSEEFSLPEDSPVVEGYATSELVEANPSKIAGVNIKFNNQAVDLNWNLESNSKTYEVSRYNSTKRIWETLGKVNKNQFQDKFPQKGVRNYYVIRGIGKNTTGPWSDAIDIFVGASNNNTKPSRVINLKATRGEMNGIQVNWSASPGASVYVLYRYLSHKSKWAPPLMVNTNQYTDTSEEAKSGNPIAYVVVAGNSAGYSDYSDYVYGMSASSLQAGRGNILPPPTDLHLKVESGVANLSWSPVKNSEEYYIFTKKKGNSKLEFLSSTKNNSFVYKLNPDGERLFFAVKSKSMMGGESAPSALVLASFNKVNKPKKTRFLKEAGIQNFLGTWTASYWDGKKSIQNLVLEISSEGNRFKANLTSNGSSVGTYTGTYAAMSDFLETKDFRLQAKGPEGKISEIAELMIGNSRISKNTIEIGFIREN